MTTILNILYNNLNQVLFTIITAIMGYISIKIKNYLDDKTTKEIVLKVVRYVEQIEPNLSCQSKKKKAYQLASDWLKQKKISISEVELDILIESSVNCL